MRHLLVPALLSLAVGANALDIGIRASYDKLPGDATTSYDISGGGFAPSSSEWDVSGTATRKALGLSATIAWTDMGVPASDGFLARNTALVSSLGVELLDRNADEGEMTSASSTELRGLYWEPGVVVAIGQYVAVEACARLAMGRGTYAEDGLGDASASYRTYGAVLRPVLHAYGVELFLEAA